MAERSVTVTFVLSDEDQQALTAKIAHMNEFIATQRGQFTRWSEEAEIRSIVAGGLAELRAHHQRARWRLHQIGGDTGRGLLATAPAGLPDWLQEIVDRSMGAQ